MTGILSLLFTVTVVYSNRKPGRGDIGLLSNQKWNIGCNSDSIFGLVSGGDSNIEKHLELAWGVGTTVTAYFSPIATDVADQMLNFGNFLLQPNTDGNCNSHFSDWLHETFATKKETKKWIHYMGDAVRSDSWNLISGWKTNDVTYSQQKLKDGQPDYETFINGGRKPGSLLTDYVDRLKEARDATQKCAYDFLSAAADQGFESWKIAALAAGARCSVDYFSILHIVFATLPDGWTSKGSLKNDLDTVKRRVRVMKRNFFIAVQKIKATRRDTGRLFYKKYEGDCRRTTRSFRHGCDKTTTTSRGITCVYEDRAFVDTKSHQWTGAEVKAHPYRGYHKECGKKDVCKAVAEQACDNDKDKRPKESIINSKMPALDNKLRELYRRVFIIDFTDVDDILTQMIDNIKLAQKNRISNGKCALRRNHACTGSRYTDRRLFTSKECMGECNRTSWCKCITMNKSFGCRLESGDSIYARRHGENKYWALRERDCPRMTETEVGAESVDQEIESWAETVFGTESGKEAMTESWEENSVGVESENEKLKETNEALSAILRELENQ